MRIEDRILCGDFREVDCPTNAAVVFVDPPYGIKKRYSDSYLDNEKFDYWVSTIVEWSTAPWTLIIGPYQSMRGWLHKVPEYTRLLIWHKSFTRLNKYSRDFTYSLSPVLVYRKLNAPWYGPKEAGGASGKEGLDLITAHSQMGDSGRLARLKLSKKDVNHPSATGTQFPLKLLPILSKEGDLVIDPMCGMGSILVAAIRLKRDIWGCELNSQYHQAAVKWVSWEYSNSTTRSMSSSGQTERLLS